jgi:hypothetical protein
MLGSAVAAKSADVREKREIADKPDKVYGQVKNSRLPDRRMFTKKSPQVINPFAFSVLSAPLW